MKSKGEHEYIEKFRQQPNEKRMQAILDLFEYTTKLLEHSFEAEPSFKTCFREIFEYVLNVHQDDTAELFARSLDRLLKKTAAGGSKHTDAQIENIFQRTFFLFKFLNAKDVFDAFYSRMLG